MASPGLTEIVTTTLRNRKAEIADNVTKNNALLARLREKKRVRKVGGGRTIVCPLDYAENSSFMYYSGYEALNISPSDVLSAAEYDWKQASVVVSISGREQRMNKGAEEIQNLLRARINNAKRTLSNNISTGIYSDGTGSGGKQITGLQAMVSGTPSTGTVGGIDASAYAFWRNNEYDFSDESVTASKTTIKTAMNREWLKCTRGNDKPDLIVADANFFNFYWESLQDLQRYTSADSGVGGFQSLKYVTADVVFDGDSGIPTNTMYMLNTDFLEFVVHKDADFAPLADRVPVNQDALVMPIIFMGNLTCSNRSLQSVIEA